MGIIENDSTKICFPEEDKHSYEAIRQQGNYEEKDQQMLFNKIFPDSQMRHLWIWVHLQVWIFAGEQTKVSTNTTGRT